MWYAILGAVLLAGDQILKYWVVTHLAVGESAPFLPGFMQLTRLHNYGAAWSSFSGRTVLLVVFTAVLLAVFVHPVSYWQLIPPGLLFVAVYAASMWLFGMNRYERGLVSSMLGKIFRRGRR